MWGRCTNYVHISIVLVHSSSLHIQLIIIIITSSGFSIAVYLISKYAVHCRVDLGYCKGVSRTPHVGGVEGYNGDLYIIICAYYCAGRSSCNCMFDS